MEKTDLLRRLHSTILDNTGAFAFDLPGLAAWSLSREEEHGAGNWTIKGRFPFDQSQAGKDGFFQRPFVDILIERFCGDVIRLRDRMGYRTPKIKRPWPMGKKAAVCFTHDVDLIDGKTALWARRAFWKVKMLKSLARGDHKVFQDVAGRLKRWHADSADPVWSIPDWIEQEKRLGIRSTFYFFALGRNLGMEGRRYSFKHPKLAQALKILDKEGFEVGLHTASKGAGSVRYLKLQRERLALLRRKQVLSARNHFLNVRFPKSWELMEKAGFSTSSNMGWNGGNDGFRAGTCWPYKPGQIPGLGFKGEIMEIPFALMDRARLDDVELYVEKAKRMMSQVKKVGGVFVINFHADYFDAIEAPGVHEAYLSIAKKVVSDSDLWVAPVWRISKACIAGSPLVPSRPTLNQGANMLVNNLSSNIGRESANM